MKNEKINFAIWEKNGLIIDKIVKINYLNV